MTIVLDFAGGANGFDRMSLSQAVEIVGSRAGQSADQVIERLAHRLAGYGEALVVTDDSAERDTVASAGGMVSSCLNFIQTVAEARADLEREIKHYNQSERLKFKRAS